jgi:hypothetical protein
METKKMTETRFNLFSNIVFTENAHTSLLKKILSRTGKHNQGDLFFKSFVTDVLKGIYSSKLRIEREVKSGKKGFIDLIIDTADKKTIYIIENKIRGAQDRPSQLYRYWRNHIKTAEDNNIKGDFRLFFLTKKGGGPSTTSLKKPEVKDLKYHIDGLPNELNIEDIHKISYLNNIKPWLELCLKQIPETKENLRLICTLEQYIEWIKLNCK